MRTFEIRVQAWWYVFLTGMLIISAPVGVALGLYCYYLADYTDVSAVLFGLTVPALVFGSWWNTEVRWSIRTTRIRSIFGS